ncbi:MAG: tRNA uridine-5-carboxymethylaminomethyl(34) synthesis enzyme MnmG, partial [Candidatus Zixiibacteriota bacterium]
IKYEGYITKQDRDIARFHKMESAQIPDEFDYAIVTGLKREALEKFGRYRPYSLGQAGRLEGVTPGDLAILSVYLKRHKEAHGSA